MWIILLNLSLHRSIKFNINGIDTTEKAQDTILVIMESGIKKPSIKTIQGADDIFSGLTRVAKPAIGLRRNSLSLVYSRYGFDADLLESFITRDAIIGRKSSSCILICINCAVEMFAQVISLFRIKICLTRNTQASLCYYLSFRILLLPSCAPMSPDKSRKPENMQFLSVTAKLGCPKSSQLVIERN